MSNEPSEAKTSYFLESETQKMQSKFLNLKELIIYSYHLFTRSSWQAFASPVLKSLIILLLFVEISATLAIFYATYFASVFPSIILSIVNIVLFGAWCIGFLVLLIQLSIRSSVIVEDSSATFWRPKVNIWLIFWRRLFLTFVIGFAFIVPWIFLLLLQSYALTSFSDNIIYGPVTGILMVLTILWTVFLSHPFYSLVSYKDYSVKQAILVGFHLITQNLKGFIFRHIWLNLAQIAFPLVNIAAIYAIYSLKITDPTIYIFIGLLLMIMQFVSFVFGIFFWSMLYTSFTNLYLLNDAKHPDKKHIKPKNNILVNILIGVAVIATIGSVPTLIAVGYQADELNRQIRDKKSQSAEISNLENPQIFNLNQTATNNNLSIIVNRFYLYKALDDKTYCVTEGQIENKSTNYTILNKSDLSLVENGDENTEEYAGLLSVKTLWGIIVPNEKKEFVSSYKCTGSYDSNYIFKVKSSDKSFQDFQFNLKLDPKEELEFKLPNLSMSTQKLSASSFDVTKQLKDQIKIEPLSNLLLIPNANNLDICGIKVELTNISQRELIVNEIEFVIISKTSPAELYTSLKDFESDDLTQLTIRPKETQEMNLILKCDRNAKKYVLGFTPILYNPDNQSFAKFMQFDIELQ